jgi:UDP-N-acetylmuramoyl-tripeptide--D-alanyl-D-alanine ligase
MTTGAETLRLTLDEVRDATGAELVRGDGAAPVLEGLGTDSRRVVRRGLFVGLPGEKFDGSDYAPAAVEAGAAAVLVSRAKWPELRGRLGGAAVLLSDSPLLALGLLARWHRRRMPAKVVAITGSNGKTTTKEMLRCALEEAGPTLATEGNLNNEIGAPLTLLGLRPEHAYAAIEIGMNHEGEIGRLTAMVQPDVGVVTNAAGVHVEALGSVENVSRAKGELYHGLALDGLVVANADDPLMHERARWAGRKTSWFGTAGVDVRLAEILSHDARGLRCRLEHRARSYDVTLPVVGLHNAMNACAAFAAAVGVGVPPERVIRGLTRARPPGRRLRLTPIPGAGATLLDDCYNANPASTIAALKTLAELAPDASNRIAVIGDMRELGGDEMAGHREVGLVAARGGLKLLVAFGAASRHVASAARDAGLPAAQVLHTDDPAAAADRVRAALGEGDLVLVKASRGTRLERVSELLAPTAAETH